MLTTTRTQHKLLHTRLDSDLQQQAPNINFQDRR